MDWSNSLYVDDTYVSSDSPNDNFYEQYPQLLNVNKIIYIQGNIVPEDLQIGKIRLYFNKVSGPTSLGITCYGFTDTINLSTLTYNTQPDLDIPYNTNMIVSGDKYYIDITKYWKLGYKGFAITCTLQTNVELSGPYIFVEYIPTVLAKPAIIYANSITLDWSNVQLIKPPSFQKLILYRANNPQLLSPVEVYETEDSFIRQYVDTTVQSNSVYYYFIEVYTKIGSSGIINFNNKNNFLISNAFGEIADNVLRMTFHPYENRNIPLYSDQGFIYNPDIIMINGSIKLKQSYI